MKPNSVPAPHVQDLPEFAEVDTLIHDLEARLRVLEGYYGEHGEFADGSVRPMAVGHDASSFARIAEFQRKRLETVVEGEIALARAALHVRNHDAAATPTVEEQARALLNGTPPSAPDASQREARAALDRLIAEADAIRRTLIRLYERRERVREILRVAELQRDPRVAECDRLWSAALAAVRDAVAREDALLDDLAQRGFGRHEPRPVHWLQRDVVH